MKCVGNPENLIIDHVNYENLHQSSQIDVLAESLHCAGILTRWYCRVGYKQICGMLTVLNRLIHKINDFYPILCIEMDFTHRTFEIFYHWQIPLWLI